MLDSNTSELALDDRNVALAVAKYCPQDFIMLSERLRADKDILIDVLNNLPCSIDPDGHQPIELASDELQDDDQIALLSIQKNPCSIQWLSYRLTDNENIAKLAMDKTPLAYPGLSWRLRDREDYILAYVNAVTNSPTYSWDAVEYLPEKLGKFVKECGFSVASVHAWLLNEKLTCKKEKKSGLPYEDKI